MKKIVNLPEDRMKRMGAYSHSYKVSLGEKSLVMTSGLVALDKEANVVAPNDVEKQTEYVFESLRMVLKEQGASFDDVVKATIYLTNADDFSIVSGIRNRYFKNSEPVSSMIEVTKIIKDGLTIEIDVIAVTKN